MDYALAFIYYAYVTPTQGSNCGKIFEKKNLNKLVYEFLDKIDLSKEPETAVPHFDRLYLEN